MKKQKAQGWSEMERRTGNQTQKTEGPAVLPVVPAVFPALAEELWFGKRKRKTDNNGSKSKKTYQTT